MYQITIIRCVTILDDVVSLNYEIYLMSIKNMKNILKKQISMFSKKKILETKVSERFVSETF